MGYISNACNVGFFFFFIVLLSCVLISLGLIVGQGCREEWAKLTSFECGFEPLSSTSNPFSLRFFVLALLFLVFDVEIILLVPFIYSVDLVYLCFSFKVLFFCVLFIILLVVGLAHEYNEGALEWVKDL